MTALAPDGVWTAPADDDCRVSFAAGVDREAAVDRAIAVLRQEGVVVLDNLVDPSLVARCRDEIAAAHPDMTRVDRERNFGPYVGRHTMPIVLGGALGDRDVFLPRPVSRIAKAVFGDTFKIDSIGLLVSIPGSPDQKRHPDATLFPELDIDRLVQPFAMAFALPLVPMDAVSGMTAFWRRSHRQPGKQGEHDFAPIVQPGSAILWDYRIHHAGLANRGDRPRPVVFTALSREWWVEMEPPEATRYEKLLVARDLHAALSPVMQRRLSRATLVD